MSSLRLGLCVCVCWICSLDGALPLGQEALISCGGGVGRIRVGSQLWVIPDVVWNHRGAADPEEAGGRALERRPRLRLGKEGMRPLR